MSQRAQDDFPMKSFSRRSISIQVQVLRTPSSMEPIPYTVACHAVGQLRACLLDVWISDTAGGPDKPEQLYFLFCDQTVTAALSQVSRRYRAVAYFICTSRQSLFYFNRGHERHLVAPVLPVDPVRWMQTCTRCQERHSDVSDGQVYTDAPTTVSTSSPAHRSSIVVCGHVQTQSPCRRQGRQFPTARDSTFWWQGQSQPQSSRAMWQFAIFFVFGFAIGFGVGWVLGRWTKKPVVITKIKIASVVPEIIKFTKRSGAGYETTTGLVGVEPGRSSRDGLPGACQFFSNVGAATPGRP